jgi:glutaminyl-peptide cyclotransferase
VSGSVGPTRGAHWEVIVSKLQAIVLMAVVAFVGCHRDKSPNPLQAGEDLLYQGKPREAIEMLATVPWSAPEAMAARRLIAETCTRIDLSSQGAGPARPRVDLVEIVSTLPHDASCFTEGLEFDGNTLLESCGLYEKSIVRRVDVHTGAVLQEHRLNSKYYGEGLTQFGGSIFVLTWLEGAGLVLDSKLTQQERIFAVQGEGWGMTHDATSLICSNGSNEIRFLDPKTGAIKKVLKIFNGELPLMNINELEYVNGELLANIWPTERIARIDPVSGRLLGWILAEGLLPNRLRFKADVLNGIAYDSAGERLFLTGKLWPTTFVVRLKPLTL